MAGRTIKPKPLQIEDVETPSGKKYEGRYKIRSSAKNGGAKPVGTFRAKRSFECNVIGGANFEFYAEYEFTKGAVFPIYEVDVVRRLTDPSVDAVTQVH